MHIEIQFRLFIAFENVSDSLSSFLEWVWTKETGVSLVKQVFKNDMISSLACSYPFF